MASTYVNNLRLNEMATGDASGTWGTTTNTNLELIGEALGYGTEAITTNADTHTSTVADGASDAARAMYIKYTGTLDSTCTITIAPNTMKRVQIIENATSGSQSIIISQGSGANVTIPTGKVAVVYLDGAGSGAAVVNAFTDLDLAGTLGVAGISSSGAIVPSASDGAALGSASLEWSDLFLADGAVINFGDDQDITLTHTADTGLATNGTFQATTITATTAFVPDASDGAALGTSSLEFSDLFLADAAVINLGDDQDTTLTHVADTGILLNSTRQLQFGDSGTYIHQSADGVLDLVSDTEIEINATTIDINGAADVSGALTAGTVNGVGISSNISNFTSSILISNDAGTGTLSSANYNTGLGWEVFDDLTSGDNNVGLGYQALTKLTTGLANTAVGSGALAANTTANSNIAIGTDALNDNTTGALNTAVGTYALDTNTTAERNTAIGYAAMDANTTGQYNTALGANALDANTTADNNVAVGYNSLGANTTGHSNTALGSAALDANTTGNNNVAIGINALGANTTGTYQVAIGRNALLNSDGVNTNVAVGYNTLQAVTTGLQNTAVGYVSGDALTTANNNTSLGYATLSTACGNQNTALGSQALFVNEEANNTAVGYAALFANTTGVNNTAVGSEAAIANTTGGYNVAVGYQSLDANTTGGSNTAIGYNTLGANTTADNNTAVGSNCLKLNTTGHSNTGVGVACLDANTTAIHNTAVGRNALGGATTGGYNTAVGSSALITCSTGARNTAVGYDALDAVTTGDDNTGIGTIAGAAITTGSDNTIVGAYAANQITTGSTNTAMGYDALTRCTTGGGNSCFGKDAGDNVTTGGQNVCIGQDAGTTIAQGDYNICVGSIADVSSGTNANSIAIGHNIAASGNTFSFGKASNVVSNTFTSDATWSRSSDINKKTNIENTDLGLSFINELRPVTFNWKPNTEFPKHFKDYSETENHMDTETNLYGMIAQDVEKALDKVGHKNFGGWSEEEDGSQRLSQEMFIYPLINAVKELSAQVEELKAKLNQGE